MISEPPKAWTSPGLPPIAATTTSHNLVRDFKSFLGLARSRWRERELGNVQAQPVAQV